MAGQMFLAALMLLPGAFSQASDAVSPLAGPETASARLAAGRWYGPWDLTTPYRKDDTVIHKGETFVALEDNFMVEPGSDLSSWRLLPAAVPAPAGTRAIGAPSSRKEGAKMV